MTVSGEIIVAGLKSIVPVWWRFAHRMDWARKNGKKV